jgi:hypothetical protein
VGIHAFLMLLLFCQALFQEKLWLDDSFFEGLNVSGHCGLQELSNLVPPESACVGSAAFKFFPIGGTTWQHTKSSYLHKYTF